MGRIAGWPAAEFCRYVAVQAGVTALDYGAYLLFLALAPGHALPAFVAARAIAGLAAFTAHARLTFGHGETSARAAWRYGLLLVANAAMGTLLLKAALVNAGPLLAKLMADGAAVALNYVLIRRFVFPAPGAR